MNLNIDPGVVLSIIALVAGITIFSFIRSRHIERMQQLEMGIPLEGGQRSFVEIKFGLLFMGIGLGLLSAFTIGQVFDKNVMELYPALSFLFGGLGLLTSFFVVQHQQRKE